MFYISQGNIPSKRHIQHRNNQGRLFYEEHISREGFSSIYSNVYHENMPTEISEVGDFTEINILKVNGKHKNRHFFTKRITSSGDAIQSRKALFFNDDLFIHKSHINESMDYFYKNSHYDELIYVQSGKGLFSSNFGDMKITPGDYIVIPKGVIWRMDVEENLSCLIIETCGPIETPNKYRNRFGQLMEHSPFCERDISIPKLGAPKVGTDIKLKSRLAGGIQEYTFKNHPCDLVGWDGCYYPWKLNINDFEPITGSIHQPPPVHQTFQASGLVVCSFVTRLFDFHPDAIPSPYPHSNVDSDEVIFYSMGDFMSRNGIEEESITLHPAGITHGPHPGKYEGSIGKKETEELAVMIDTFKPLKIVDGLIDIEDKEYYMSWII